MKKICFAISLLLLTSIPFIGVAQNSTLETPHVGEYPPYNAPMPTFSTPVTIEELRDAYYSYSVVAIVNVLHENMLLCEDDESVCRENDEANSNYIFNKVASGDEEWIHALVTYVSPGTDASASTEVMVTLARALSNNPKAILALDKKTIAPSLYNICGLPFIEPEYEFIKAHGKKTLKALRQVDDPELLDSRDACIRRLQEGLDYCDQLYKEGKWNNK